MPRSAIISSFRHTAIYSLAGIIQKAVGFIMLPIYAKYLGAEGYGIVGMIDVVMSVLTIFIGFGISGGLMRFYFEKETEDEKKVIVSTALLLALIIILFISLPAFVLNKQLAYLAFGKRGLEFYIILSVLIFIAETTASNASAYIYIKKYSILYTVLSLARLLVGLTLNIYLIIVLKWGVLGVLYSNLVAATFNSIVTHAYAFKKVGFHYNHDDSMKILHFSVPLLPGYIALFLRNNSDRIILRSLLGLSQVGVYSMILKFSSLISLLVISPFLQIWNVKRLEICEQNEGQFAIARMFTFHYSFMLLFGLLLSVEVPVILKILTPKEFWIPSYYVTLVVYAQILFGCYYHFNFGLIYAKRTFNISKIQVLVAITSVILNMALIRFFELLGACIALEGSNFLFALLALKWSSKYYLVKYEWNKILQLTGSALFLLIVINYAFMNGYNDSHFFYIDFYEFILKPLKLLNLNVFLNSKIIIYANNNKELINEGVVKGLFSLIFISSLFFCRILKWEQIKYYILFQNSGTK